MNLKNEVLQEEPIENRSISRREFLFASIGMTTLGTAILSSCGKTVKVSEIERQSETRDSKSNIKEGQPMIIDTHTHFYDPTRTQGAPWPDPNDKVLYRRVLPADYKDLAVPQGVSGTIVVEASEWIEDNQWILDLAA
ncbi:MAG: L-fuconolactonase, partial [Candidatus Poribacteria bacterium]|nr:L-fuconolactonase [Candidatus Poribacteria bacterium]